MTDLRWELRSFEELSANALFAILKTRQAVFVVEQACAYPDIDELDQQAWHLVAWDETEKVAAYARLIAPGIRYTQASIGRVLIAENIRGRGLAKELMHRAIDFFEKTFPEHSIKIGAQTYLEVFYQQLGFTTISDAYDEDGIMHIDMIRKFGKSLGIAMKDRQT